MIRFWLFVHILGFTLWIGGALAAMVAGIAGRGEDRAGLGTLVRTQAAVQKTLVAPGALLAVLSGVMSVSYTHLTLPTTSRV